VRQARGANARSDRRVSVIIFFSYEKRLPGWHAFGCQQQKKRDCVRGTVIEI
jgi:hypothetical protein